MDDNKVAGVSRRRVLETLSVAAGIGLAGCSESEPTGTPTRTPTATDTPTASPTPTPDRPSIERQTILRDKAAVTHVRQSVDGEAEWPDYELFNYVDGDLLGRWAADRQTFEFHDDLTFRDVRSDTTYTGRYRTVPDLSFVELEYANGETFEYLYEFSSEGGDVVLSLYDSDGDTVARYVRTAAYEDGRSVVEVFEDVVVYEPDETEVKRREVETAGSRGSGFVVSPDGYIVTNAHVVGTHRDPEAEVVYRLTRGHAYALVAGIEEETDLDESERDAIWNILAGKLYAYFEEKAAVSGASTNVRILHGTADPDEPLAAGSWAASIETTGSVYEEVQGEETWGRDVAILKVDEQEPLPTVRLGDSTELGTGSKVFSIGYPDIGLGEYFEERETTLEPSLISGVVSARRTLQSGLDTIQTDLDLNPGNSGGPVYNGDGEVVGIATFRPPDLDLAEVSFALPVSTAKGFMGEVGVENEPGALTEAYEEGLNALWRGDCETLSERMDTVTDLWPDHPYADDLVESC